MDLGIRDRTALVCGGSSGLGFAIAEGLLAEGARVAVNGRDPAKLERAVERLRQHPSAAGQSRINGFAADVGTPEGCSRLVESVRTAMGGPDILICNAGGPPAGLFESHQADAWQAALNLTLLSTIHLCRAAVPRMRAGRWGRVLCLTSVAAKQPGPLLILSTTARAGVLGFAKTLADEVAADGVTVNVLCPGYFSTERLRELAESRGMGSGRTADQVLREMGDGLPIRRIGTPEEFAAAVVFLASEPARYITGTALSVDGGLTRTIL